MTPLFLYILVLILLGLIVGFLSYIYNILTTTNFAQSGCNQALVDQTKTFAQSIVYAITIFAVILAVWIAIGVYNILTSSRSTSRRFY
jgi:uncharacterized membrane protein